MQFRENSSKFMNFDCLTATVESQNTCEKNLNIKLFSLFFYFFFTATQSNNNPNYPSHQLSVDYSKKS